MFNFSSISNFIAKSTKGIASSDHAKSSDIDFFNNIVAGKESLRSNTQTYLFLNIKDKLNFLENKNYSFTVFFPCGSSAKTRISNSSSGMSISISTKSKDLLKKLKKKREQSEEEMSEHLDKSVSLSIKFGD